MRVNGKTIGTTHHSKFMKCIIAVVVALALVVTPAGAAIALQVVRGGNADENAYQSGLVTGSSDVAAVIDQAYAQGVAGASALDSYLNGEAISEESALGIDTAALAKINSSIAQEISDLQSSLINGTYETTTAVDPDPTPTPDPEQPSDTEQPGSTEQPGDTTQPGNTEQPSDTEQPGNTEQSGSTEQPNDNANNDAGNNSNTNNDAPYVETPGAGATSNTQDNATNNSSGSSGSSNSSGSSEGSTSSGYPQWSYSGNNNYTPRNIGQSLTTTKFIAIIGEPARKIAQESGLYASVMIAQAILESGSGNSSLSATYNNIFGIKGHYEGQGVVMRTSEDDGSGSNYNISAVFRSYPTLADSLADYADLLTVSMGSFYAPAWKANAATYVDACNYLEGHYATDTSYSEKLQDLISTYELTRYDLPLDYEMDDTYIMPVVDSITGQNVIDPETGATLTEERDLVDLVIELTSHLGEDYVWGGTTPGAFDCSGLVQYSYRKVFGIELPRTTYYQCMEGEDVDFDDLHMGDLLFFTYSDGSVGHVGVYLGEDCFIEAPKTGDVIKVTSMTEKMPSFAKRIIKTHPVDVVDSEGNVIVPNGNSSNAIIGNNAEADIPGGNNNVQISFAESWALADPDRTKAVETRAREAVENLASIFADKLTASILID